MFNTDKAIKALEFDKILDMLANIAPTKGAKKRALNLLPSSNFEVVTKRQELTSNAKYMAGIKGMPSFNNLPDILDTIEKAQKNSILSPKEILEVASNLQTTRALLEYIHTDALKDCTLSEIFKALIPNKTLENRIFKAIISEEIIADDASPLLSNIRRKINYQSNKIREILQGFITGEQSKYLREAIVTMRNGRYVLPVKIENKSEIKGLIHDTSGTGATLFVEPLSVVEANNELRTLKADEQTEIERILAEFSSDIATFGRELFNNYQNITEIAFYFTCSELAYKLNAVRPEILTKRSVYYKKARHPLLNENTVVPIDIELGTTFKMLVITGPNTGGKTVALKTLGLFSLMAQSGLQIPADVAQVCIFDGIYPDIGDEQSIEQSLSTFSSHIVSIVNILKNVTSNSLVLFDELGAGTDPIEGAALAQSILENILVNSTLCAATTHYTELKVFALNTKDVINACCEFDTLTFMPTYRLIIGSPGKSNAFLISEKLGIPNNIINRAKSLIDEDSRNFEEVIEKLEKERVALEKERKELQAEKENFQIFKADAEKNLSNKLENAQTKSEEMIKKAQDLVTGAKASAEFIFDQLDKLQKEKDSKDFSKNYGEKKKNIREQLSIDDDIYNPVEKIDENYTLPRPLVKGDIVILRNLGTEGILLGDPDKNGNVLVQSGSIKTKTNVKNLALKSLSSKGTISSNETTKSKNKVIASKDFSVSLDVRGRNIEDAWIEIDKYIDNAILNGISMITIIHGKGTGALRKGLWEFFRKDPRIKKYRNGEYGEGDFGVTVLELKL